MSLHPLTEADLTMILAWRNAPNVRRYMYSHQEITMDEHRAWFRRMQEDPSAKWFVYRDASDTPTGVVSFTALDRTQGSAFWGFYAKPDAAPGTGTRMEFAAIELAFGDLALHKLNCEVLDSNGAVVNLHKKFGFTQEGVFRDQHFDGSQYIDVVRLGILASEWQQQSNHLRNRIKQLDALAAQRESIPPPPRKILILSDAESWINAFLDDLGIDWGELGHDVRRAHRTAGLSPADCCFCLSFGQIVPSEVRALFRHTLVVHASDLPQGKGWSPLTWQILEGKHTIPVALLEAAERVDRGAIYAQEWLEFEGCELIDDLRAALAQATIALCRWFVDRYPDSVAQARAQTGAESFYPRRHPVDSRLDPHKPIAEQFNLLRVVDNQSYPLFFDFRGQRYRVTITKY